MPKIILSLSQEVVDAFKKEIKRRGLGGRKRSELAEQFFRTCMGLSLGSPLEKVKKVE